MASTGDSPSEVVGSAMMNLLGGGQSWSSIPAQQKRPWALRVAQGTVGERTACLGSLSL